jgi:hypothetical protein
VCSPKLTKLPRYSWLTSNESNNRPRHYCEIKKYWEKLNLPPSTFGAKIDGTPAMTG